MLVVNSDDLNILNLYIALKNEKCSTELFEDRIKGLEFQKVSDDEMEKRAKHQYASGCFSPKENKIFYRESKPFLNSTKNHELIHCVTSRPVDFDNLKFDEVDGIEFVHVCGISSLLPGGVEFCNSLNEGMTDYTRMFFVPTPEEDNKKNFAYMEMASTAGLLSTMMGHHDTFNAFFNNDCKKYYELMYKHLGKYWEKIVFDCDLLFELRLDSPNKHFFLKELLSLKYNLEIVKGLLKYSPNREMVENHLKEYYDFFYHEDSLHKKIIDYKIKILQKRYSKKWNKPEKK